MSEGSVLFCVQRRALLSGKPLWKTARPKPPPRPPSRCRGAGRSASRVPAELILRCPPATSSPPTWWTTSGCCRSPLDSWTSVQGPLSSPSQPSHQLPRRSRLSLKVAFSRSLINCDTDLLFHHGRNLAGPEVDVGMHCNALTCTPRLNSSKAHNFFIFLFSLTSDCSRDLIQMKIEV